MIIPDVIKAKEFMQTLLPEFGSMFLSYLGAPGPGPELGLVGPGLVGLGPDGLGLVGLELGTPESGLGLGVPDPEFRLG
ncbi:MAG: hypothetical protein GX434_16225 [Peptococcaceae bacterium]|nr:hypothetical protein [Peptococcaceae bacterium]